MKKLVDLSKGEWLIMNRVWAYEKATAREVTEDLAKDTGWTYNTVKTMLVRLAEKGWVTENKVGGLCFYRPAVARLTAIYLALDDMIDRVLDGTFEPLLAYLGSSKRLSDKDLEALEKLIVQRGRQDAANE